MGIEALEREVCAAIDAVAEGMPDQLAAHVAIPTGWNHQLGLDRYRAILLDRVRAIGASVEMREGRPKPSWLMGGSDPVIAPIAVCKSPAMQKGAERTRILICCHIDTVFDPEGDFQEMIVSADGKTAVGPGVVDMKGGVLTTLTALEALHACGAEVAWTLMLTSDEEMGSYCSEHLIREEAAHHDIGLATEPALPGGELAVERMGSGQFRIETTGRSAHVGRNFTGGVSAVTALAESILKVAQMPDAARGKIVSVGPLRGGDATNAVPDHALAWGNARFPTKEVGEEIIAQLKTLERAADLDAGVAGVRVDHSFQRSAKPLTDGTKRLALIARAAAESLGQSLPFARTGGVCDGNILQDAGLPTIDTLGVRGGGLHTPEEWIELASLRERAQLMAVLLARLGTSGLEAPASPDASFDAGTV